MDLRVRYKCYACSGIPAGCVMCDRGYVERWMSISKFQKYIDAKDKDGYYPSWHPEHSCGWNCDGQDGGSSQCYRQKSGWNAAWRGVNPPHTCEQDPIWMKGYTKAREYGAKSWR